MKLRCLFLHSYAWQPLPPCKPIALSRHLSLVRSYTSLDENKSKHIAPKRFVSPVVFELEKNWGQRVTDVTDLDGLTQILRDTRSMKDQLDSPIVAAILGRVALIIRKFKPTPKTILREIEGDLVNFLLREKRNTSLPLICITMDSVRRFLDTLGHFNFHALTTLVGSASSYISDTAWPIISVGGEKPELSAVNSISRTVLRFLMISLIKIVSSAHHPYGSRDLDSFQKMLKLTSSHLTRENRAQIVLSLFPPHPGNANYRFVSLSLLDVTKNLRRAPTSPISYRSPDAMFLLSASFVDKGHPLVLERHENLLDLVSRGFLVWNPYVLLLLLSMRGQGLPLPARLVIEAADTVKTQPPTFYSDGIEAHINGFQRGGAMGGLASVRNFLWVQGIKGLHVMSSDAGLSNDGLYSQKDLSILMQWAESGLRRRQRLMCNKGRVIQESDMKVKATTWFKSYKMRETKDGSDQPVSGQDRSKFASSKEENKIKHEREKCRFVYLSTGQYFGQKRAAELLYSYVRGGGKDPWILNLLCDQIYPFN